MGRGYYILMGKLAVPATLDQWMKWYGSANRRVAETRIGGVWVSTVFLGLDHQWGEGPPLIFETMAFRGGSGEDCLRCSSWEEAEKQHADTVERIRREIKEKVND